MSKRARSGVFSQVPFSCKEEKKTKKGVWGVKKRNIFQGRKKQRIIHVKEKRNVETPPRQWKKVSLHWKEKKKKKKKTLKGCRLMKVYVAKSAEKSSFGYRKGGLLRRGLCATHPVNGIVKNRGGGCELSNWFWAKKSLGGNPVKA